MQSTNWWGKPYYSLDAYFKNTFGEKCYKIALNAGLSCPNRDGTTNAGGCIFCSRGGSGDFAMPTEVSSVRAQLLKGQELFHEKKTGQKFIAYFQAYTNTYGPLPYLREIYTEALNLPEVVGISIATRPDCLGDDVLALLSELHTFYPGKLIWVELGLQSIREDTALLIHRGYSLPVFEKAMADLREIGIPAIVHLILGLPGETAEDMYASCEYLNQVKPFGVKLQLLHILKDTSLGDAYLADALPGFSVLSQEAYLDILIHCLEILSPDITIHRLTGDGPKDLLIAPLWSLNKRNVMNSLHRLMRQRNTFQGRCYYDAGSTDSV